MAIKAYMAPRLIQLTNCCQNKRKFSGSQKLTGEARLWGGPIKCNCITRKPRPMGEELHFPYIIRFIVDPVKFP
jgi:hypothetical protein